MRPAFWFAAVLIVMASASCGGGDAPSFDRKQVQYAGTTLLVNRIALAVDPGDFVSDRGTIHVFTTTSPGAQAELSDFVESFGLEVGRFQTIGSEPPFSSYTTVGVPTGFEAQWAQALRTLPPGAQALTRRPCC